MLRHQKKKKGFLLIEGILMLALMTAVAFGMVSIMAGQFSTLSASKEANQAQQLAEYIASQLRQDGYENVEDFDMQESPKSADDFVGNSDLKGKYLYTVKKLSDFEVKEDSYNKVKLMEVKIYPTGYSNVPIYSLEVPLSSQAWAIPVGAVMAWPAEETPTSGGVWLECNGQSIPSQYKRLREIVGNKTPNYQGVFLRGHGSQNYSQVNGYDIDANQVISNTTYTSGGLNEIQGDSARPFGITDYYGLKFAPHTYGGWNGWTHNVLSVDGKGITYSWGDHDYLCLLNYPIPWMNGDSAYFFFEKPKHYRYQISGSAESGYSLTEYTTQAEPDEGTYFNCAFALMNWHNMEMMPISNEIRPVNIAVRYFIKAR